MSLLTPAASSSLLALVATLHLALAAVRNHRRATRGPMSSLAFVSFLLSALPWLLPSVSGVGVGLVVHGLWFLVCERFTLTPRAGSGLVAPVPPFGGTTRTATVSRPRGFVQTPVLAVIDEAPDVRTFRLARPEGFEFTAGQFLTIRVRADGRDLVRCYSLSSSPAARGYLDITVKRQGVVSGMLHSALRPALLVSIKAPAGAFIYPAQDDRPLLLLAGGIGITPLLSMLRHATEQEPARSVALLYCARREEQLAFRDEIAALARRHPQVRVIFGATEGPGHTGIYPGRIDEALIRTAMPNVRDAIALICGPEPMIDGMRRVLAAMDVPPGQIRFERFQAAVAAAGAEACERAAGSGGAAHHDSYDVRCVRSNRSVRAAHGQTLLEAAEAGGVTIDSLCRAGVCGTCRTRVVQGDVACESTALDEADHASGYVLACVAHISGPCVVEA